MTNGVSSASDWFPHTVHPGRCWRAKSSRRGPGEHASIRSYWIGQIVFEVERDDSLLDIFTRPVLFDKAEKIRAGDFPELFTHWRAAVDEYLDQMAVEGVEKFIEVFVADAEKVEYDAVRAGLVVCLVMNSVQWLPTGTRDRFMDRLKGNLISDYLFPSGNRGAVLMGDGSLLPLLRPAREEFWFPYRWAPEERCSLDSGSVEAAVKTVRWYDAPVRERFGKMLRAAGWPDVMVDEVLFVSAVTS